MSHECYLQSQLELYFNLYDNEENNNNEFVYNLCGRLKDESQLFLGLYHYNYLCELDHGRVDSDPSSTRERDCQSLEIFAALAKSEIETIETYYAWYMLGRCRELGFGVDYDDGEALKWYKKAASKGLPVACCKVGSIYSDDGQVQRGIELFAKALNGGYIHAADYLLQVYVLDQSVKDLNIAYYWATKATNVSPDPCQAKLNSYSRFLLKNMLSTGQFEWTQQQHHWWSRLQLEFISKTIQINKSPPDHIILLLETKL